MVEKITAKGAKGMACFATRTAQGDGKGMFMKVSDYNKSGLICGMVGYYEMQLCMNGAFRCLEDNKKLSANVKLVFKRRRIRKRMGKKI